jgi:hypothetical protein
LSGIRYSHSRKNRKGSKGNDGRGSMKGAFPKLKPLTREEEREIEGEDE